MSSAELSVGIHSVDYEVAITRDIDGLPHFRHFCDNMNAKTNRGVAPCILHAQAYCYTTVLQLLYSADGLLNS